MLNVVSLIRGPYTSPEAATLQEAMNRYSPHVAEKIGGHLSAIEFLEEGKLPGHWPLGASAVNHLDPKTGDHLIQFLRSRFNRGRAIHEFFHAYDFKKVTEGEAVTWKSDTESDPRAHELYRRYRTNFEHDFLKSVYDTLKDQRVLPESWFPVALPVAMAMQYPFLASVLRPLFDENQEARQASLAYLLVRTRGDSLEARGIDPAAGQAIQRSYRDHRGETFELPQWRQLARESIHQARAYPLDPGQEDRRFSEYAYPNGVREYMAEGAKWLLDTPETRSTLAKSDRGLHDYLLDKKIGKPLTV